MPPRTPNRRKQTPQRSQRSTHSRRPRETKALTATGGGSATGGQEQGERLQKVLAAAGIASRRECEQLILEGRVEVDRQLVTELGARVDLRRQEIRVDGEALPRPKLVYFAVHKPEGVVSTSRDPSGRPRVIDLLPPDSPRTYCVGRLDMSSEGLILMTNDGELANGLTHPRHGVEKVYQVQVAGHVQRETLAQLQRGMHLAEGFAQMKQVRIKSASQRSTILEMILDEGRNREIRRLLAKVGHKVQRLKRIAVGPVRLGEMPAAAVRPLTRQEIQSLHQAVVHSGSHAPTVDTPHKEVRKPPRASKPRRRKIVR